MPTDAQHAALVLRVKALEDKLAALKRLNSTLVWSDPTSSPPPPPIVPPPPPPIDPPPPPPPAGTFTPVARVVVAAAGLVELGVPIAATNFREIRSARIGNIVAQADNISRRLDGSVQWFMLSAIVPVAGTFDIAVSDAAPPAVTSLGRGPVLDILVAGASPQGYALTGLHRQGPIVIEGIYLAPIGNTGLFARVREVTWANGKSSSVPRIENGYSLPGPVTPAHPSTINYSGKLTRGAESYSFTNVAHQPMSAWLRRMGDQPVHAQLVPLGWTGSPNDGTWAYFRASKKIENFVGGPFVPLTPAPMDACPDVPFGVTDAQMIGWFSRWQGAPGSNPDIGPHPGYYITALRNFDVAGKRMITWHADKKCEAPYNLRSKATGGFYRFDEGVDYEFGSWDRSKGVLEFNGARVANQDWEFAHWGAMFYIPYLVTGDYAYLEGEIMQLLMAWISCPGDNSATDKSDCGTGMSRHKFNTHGVDAQAYWPADTRARALLPPGTSSSGKGPPQLRSIGWDVRTIVHGLAILPDDDAKLRALTGWDKTMVRTLWANVQANVKQVYDSLTGPDKHFLPGGPIYPYGGEISFKHWMYSMITSSLAIGHDLGVLTADGEDLYERFARITIGIMVNRDKFVSEFAIGGFNKIGKYIRDRLQPDPGPAPKRTDQQFQFPWVTDPVVRAAQEQEAFEQVKARWDEDLLAFQEGGPPRYAYENSFISAPARTIAESYRGTAQLVGSPGAEYYVQPPEGIWPPFNATCDKSGLVANRTKASVIFTGPAFPDQANWKWYEHTYVQLFAVDPNIWPARMWISRVLAANKCEGFIVDIQYDRATTVPAVIGRVTLPLPHPSDAKEFGQYPAVGEQDYNGWWLHVLAMFAEHKLPKADIAYQRILNYFAMRPEMQLGDQHKLEPRV